MDRLDVLEEAIGRIDLEYAEAAARKMNRKNRKSWLTPQRRTTLLAAAAALIVSLIAGGVFGIIYRKGGDPAKNTGKNTSNALLSTLNVSSSTQDIGQSSAFLPFGDRVALYSSVYLPEDEADPSLSDQNETILRQYLGELYYTDSSKWYIVDDSANLQALLREEPDGRLSLWQFSCFQTWGEDLLKAEFPDSVISEYEYKTLLAALYHVDSAADIARIEILPVTGYRCQNEDPQAETPEKIVINARKDIEGIYEILKKMTCYGTGSLADQTEALFSPELQNAFLADNSLYERDVRLILKDGSTIEGLKYSAVWGAFYEQGGIAYGGLTPTDVETMNYYADIRTH